jgi:hypothetical protein
MSLLDDVLFRIFGTEYYRRATYVIEKKSHNFINSSQIEKSQLSFTSHSYQAMVEIYETTHSSRPFCSPCHICNSMLYLNKQ